MFTIICLKIHLFLYILLKIHLFLDFYSSVAHEYSKLRGEPRALSLYLCFCLFVNVVVVVVLFSVYRDLREKKRKRLQLNGNQMEVANETHT